MKIKVTLYGFGNYQFPDGFFDSDSIFRRNLDHHLGLSFPSHSGYPRLVCDELEVITDPSNQSIPRFYFADFELEGLPVHTEDALSGLADRLCITLRNHVHSYIDRGSVVVVRANAGRLFEKLSPHYHELT